MYFYAVKGIHQNLDTYYLSDLCWGLLRTIYEMRISGVLSISPGPWQQLDNIFCTYVVDWLILVVLILLVFL